MTRNTLIPARALAIAAALSALGLSACEGGDGHMVNAKICANFNTGAAPGTAAAATPAVSADAGSPVDDCLRRWGYSLAGARDPADAVANATVAACGTALSRWSQASLGAAGQGGGGQGISLTTGLPTNPMAEQNAYAHGRALFYVVQARAGRCAPPPVVNGVPAGT
jgi:hypothetical protein